jgi:hypothetical protein
MNQRAKSAGNTGRSCPAATSMCTLIITVDNEEGTCALISGSRAVGSLPTHTLTGITEKDSTAGDEMKVRLLPLLCSPKKGTNEVRRTILHEVSESLACPGRPVTSQRHSVCLEHVCHDLLAYDPAMESDCKGLPSPLYPTSAIMLGITLTLSFECAFPAMCRLYRGASWQSRSARSCCLRGAQ